MTALLAAIGGVSTAGALVAVIVLAFRYAGAMRDLLAASDMLNQERAELRNVRGDLAVETAAHAETRRLLLQEQDLRASVESQRNDAYRRARDYYAARIKSSGVADAVRLIDDLLSVPLPGVHETVPAGDPNRTDDDLIDPGL